MFPDVVNYSFDFINFFLMILNSFLKIRYKPLRIIIVGINNKRNVVNFSLMISLVNIKSTIDIRRKKIPGTIIAALFFDDIR